jgi:hypothetical protein
MIEYDFKGISIIAETHMVREDFKDADDKYRTRFDRHNQVKARFWDFIIDDSLTELALVKSSLNYFMQSYWKRSSKEGSKIDLAKGLNHEDSHAGKQSLYFVARQKDQKHFLHICLQQSGATVNETYLDGQEVIMLDIAIGKAISLLMPRAVRGLDYFFD